MHRFLMPAAAAMIAASACAEEPAGSTRYENAMVFTGQGFEAATLYVRDGEFVDPFEGGKVVDLAGSYIIPPYCEGHNHNLAVGKPEERSARYLTAGVFYVKIPNNLPDYANQERPFYARPDTVDAAFSHGGLTGVGGHPVEVLEGVRRSGGYPGVDRIEDRAYFEVGNTQDLEQKLALLLVEKPDFVKVFLQFSEDYDQRKDDPAFYGNRGLDPKLLPGVVAWAHSYDLEAVVHVVSAYDFHVAVEAGVDEIAHLPGYMTPEIIAVADAKTAAEKGIEVATTVGLARSISGKNENIAEIEAAQRQNLETLKDAGVTLVVGSDSWSDSSHREASLLQATGLFSTLDLLTMWTVNCPASVFPERKLGHLEPGYEASFLALGGNPLDDFAATRNIKLRVKQGFEIVFEE